MQNIRSFGYPLAVIGAFVAGLGGLVTVQAQNVSGQARSVQATIAGSQGVSTTTLADTGTLGGPADAREASQDIGAIDASVSGEALHATTIGYSDHVESEASIANVAINVGNVTVSADFAMSRALAGSGSDSGVTTVEGLVVNGTSIEVTGGRDQRVAVDGALVVINEQQKGQGGITVNALHVIVDGAADILIASSSARR
jgi:hypothetical protein